jgi:hypothetical protein
MSATELREAFLKKIGEKLREHASDADTAVALRVDRWIDVFTGALRDLGKARGCEVAPIRRGVGELGWELCWGRSLQPGYAQLGSTNPKDLFRLELVAEISEASLRAGTRGESAVEEISFDLARLVWARCPLKVLVFGARRESEPANSIEALEAGLAGVVRARDEEAEYLLVALPNLEGARTTSGSEALLWTKVVSRGKPEPAKTTRLSELF